MDKIRVWVWWRFNRKASSKWAIYASTVVPWMVVGFLVVFSLAAVTAMTASGFLAALIFLLVIVGLGGYCIWFDRRMGYVDALHQNYVRERKERMKKYGLEEKNE